MASSTSATGLPPKVPLTSSLSEHLANGGSAAPPRGGPVRAPSTGSNMSDSSRDGLRREIVRRRKSLSESEFNFLQGVVANGTEVEVMLVHQKLNDPSLCFDVNDDEEEEDGEDDHGRRSSLGSVHTPTQQLESNAYTLPPPPMDMVGQLLCPTLSMEDTTTLGSFDPEASIDTCATGRGKPPAIPMPVSPRRDLADFRTPSHAELYPDTHGSHFTRRRGGQGRDAQPFSQQSLSELEQTPLVQNLRPPKSLEGAAQLPIGIGGNGGGNGMLHHPDEDLMTPATNNTTTAIRAAAALHRRSSNPLVDQLWRAHEQGLSLTPQQSTRRIQLRREHSLSAVSPVRTAMMRRYSSVVGSAASMDHSRSLLNPEELRLIKQRHFRTNSQLSLTSTDHQHSHPNHQHHWRQPLNEMMMVLQNTSTDSSMENNNNDITSLLLPTDEEIFRRSLQAHKRPPPPRPFNNSSSNHNKTDSKSTTTTSSGIPKPPNALNRMMSEGAPTGGATLPRRPSALRRMTSDGSQRSKSVSFQIQTPQQPPMSLSVPSHTEGMDDSLSTYASEHHHHPTEILRDGAWGRRDSEASLNLHKAHPIRQESIGSTASGWEAAYAFQQGLLLSSESSSNKLNRKDSINSVASLNLHRAHPIRQESIGSTMEGAYANRNFQAELAASRASASLMDNSSGHSLSRRDSRSSIASLNLHRAHPIRQDSISSVATGDGNVAMEAFRRQFSAGKGFGRRESLNSLASLDLHIATPIIQDEIFQRQDSLDCDSIVAAGGEVADSSEAFRPNGWKRRDSMSSITSMDLHRANPIIGRRDSTNSLASLRLELAHPIRSHSIASVAEGLSAVEAFREQVASQSWGRRDSCNSVASLNLHKAHPIRQESICSNAGFDATESLRRQFLVEPNTVLKPTWGRQSSMGSLASLNLHKAHPLAHPLSSESAAAIEALRNQGSAFVSESELFDVEASLNSIPPALTEAKDATEALRKQVEDGSGAFRVASPGTVLSSASDIAGLQTDSLRSIPSLHHGRPLRQESISSTATGLQAKEMLQKQVSHASIVASEWEGVVLPDSWEDKKMDEDADFGNEEHLTVTVSKADVPRPVMMRLASQNECDEEGMEVAAVDELARELAEEHSPRLKLKTQILVPEPPEGVPRRESGSVPPKDEADFPEREKQTKQRQQNYRHFPNSLVSFGADSARSSGFEGRSSSHTIEVSASFDESKSVDRYRGVFRGTLPRSVSEDELSALLMAHCKPKPLSRGQSDATVFPTDLNSSSWELDTVVGDYDAWDAIRDDYVNGYGGGGTLPFQILGTSARDVDSQPHVLSPPLMESLQSFFPVQKSQDNFWMKYSLVRDGASLHTLMHRARGASYSILALETTDGEVFGSFTTEPWRKTWNYFGSGESFLWRMRNSRKTKCYSIIDQAAMESEIDVYPYTGANQNVQLCTHTLIAVGGGTPEHTEAEEKRDDNDNHHQSLDLDKDEDIKDYEWGYGLALQADLQHGTSSPCLTFGSPSLSKAHSDGSVFEICNVELWTLTPCWHESDAEKLELGRLFLERSPSFNSSQNFF